MRVIHEHMFGLGMGEILIILVLALVLLGPQKLPEAAKQLGKGLREFRRATDDLKAQFEGELYAGDARSASSRVQAEPAGEKGEGPKAGPSAGVAEAPRASAENIPGLEAALAEPKREARTPTEGEREGAVRVP